MIASQKKEEFDFANPDYGLIGLERIKKIQALDKNPDKIPALKRYYRDHVADFINDYGITVDPRNIDLGLPATIPFVLFPRQREFVDWVVEKWRKRDDGICVKSRDMGVSWLCAAIAASFFCLYDEFFVGFGSRKEEYVDSPMPRSLFWKIEQFIRYIPRQLKPLEVVKTHMRIEATHEQSYIVGEAGDNIGRGDRTSIYFLDEAAFIERQERVDAALSQTSNCKIWVSTIGEPGDAFHQKQIGGQFDIFEFDWREDPRKSVKWYYQQKKKYEHDPVLFAREIDRDYSASSGDSWIPADLIEEAQSLGPADILQEAANQKLILGVDAAHLGDDESVFSPRAGRIAYKQSFFSKKTGPELASKVIEYCDTAPTMVFAIVIELDGPGVSCYDALRQHERYGQLVYGVHTSSGGDERNFNLRAGMYRKAKEWLANKPCSVPRDPRFGVQLSSIKYSYRGGKLLLQSKKEMRAHGFKSPDRADAFALTFAVDEDMLSIAEHEAERVPESERSPYAEY